MNDFIYITWFMYKNVTWWGWRKNPKYTNDEIKEKIHRLVTPPIPLVYAVEVDCFSVSENKPDLPERGEGS